MELYQAYRRHTTTSAAMDVADTSAIMAMDTKSTTSDIYPVEPIFFVSVYVARR